ncbi:MAG: filamentous hemagglutinin N-terminal domain-containing protein [Phycisphaerales bacterium]
MTKQPNLSGGFARRHLLAATLLSTAHLGSLARGDVTGATVVNGQVTITVNGNTWTFSQATMNAIVNYGTFNVAGGEVFHFIQPAATARILNRVQGDFPTNINGKLLANGIVYIVNPAGVFIGPNGLVDVGGLYAAAGSITDQAFLAGKDKFTDLKGGVANYGTVLATKPGARVHLLGSNVTNGGTIEVGENGLLSMVSSTGTVTLQEIAPDNQLLVSINSAGAAQNSTVGTLNTGELKGGAGSRLVLAAGDIYSVAIRNGPSGSIKAASGHVEMRASKGTLPSGAIADKGSIEAGTLDVSSGEFQLGADIKADSVTIDSNVVLIQDAAIAGATAQSASSVSFLSSVDSRAGQANSLTVTADTTTFEGEVGGATQGALGTLAVQGDVAFGGNVTAESIALGSDAQSTTSLTGAGDQALNATGGSLVNTGSIEKNTLGDLALIANTNLDVAGDVKAQDGGVTTTSTTGYTNLGGKVKASGSVKLTANTNLDVGGDVTAQGGGVETTSTNGYTNVVGSVTASGGAVKLTANTNLDVGGDVTAQGDVTTKTTPSMGGHTKIVGAVTSQQGRVSLTSDADLEAGSISAKTGVAAASLAGSTTVLGAVSSETGGVTLAANKNLDVGADVTAQGGGVETTSTNGYTNVVGSVTALGGGVTLTANTNLDVGGDVTAQGGGVETTSTNGYTNVVGSVTASGGGVTLTANTNLDVGGDVTAQGEAKLIAGTDLAVHLVSGMSGVLVKSKGGSANIAGPVTSAAGGATLKAKKDLKVGGSVGALGGALETRSTDGSTNIQGDVVALSGVSLNAGTNLDVGGDVTAQGGGVETTSANGYTNVVGSVTASGGGVTLTANTNLDVGGAVTANGEVSTTSTAGYSAIGGDVTSTAGNVTLTAQTNLGVDGNLTATAGGVTLNAPAVHLGPNAMKIAGLNGVTFSGEVTSDASSLELDGGSVQGVHGGGSVVATNGAITFSSPVWLSGDLSVIAAQSIAFDGTVDSVVADAWSLTASAQGGDLLFRGDVGGESRLGSLVASAPTGTIVFDNALGAALGITVQVHDLVSLDEPGRATVPSVATIGSSGPLAFFGSQFRMGQNEKLSSLGPVTIDMTQSAALSDINSLGDVAVSAPQIQLLTRAPGAVEGSPGLDNGLDFYTGGKYYFSTVPVKVGSYSSVEFGSINGEGDTLGTLATFTQRAVTPDKAYGPADLVSNDGRTYFDLIASGPSNADVSTALAGAESNEQEAVEASTWGELSSDQEGALEELLPRRSIVLRTPTESDYLLFAAGEAILTDVADVARVSAAKGKPDPLPVSILRANSASISELLAAAEPIRKKFVPRADGSGAEEVHPVSIHLGDSATASYDLYLLLKEQEALATSEAASASERAAAQKTVDGLVAIGRFLRAAEQVGLSGVESQSVYTSAEGSSERARRAPAHRSSRWAQARVNKFCLWTGKNEESRTWRSADRPLFESASNYRKFLVQTRELAEQNAASRQQVASR